MSYQYGPPDESGQLPSDDEDDLVDARPARECNRVKVVIGLVAGAGVAFCTGMAAASLHAMPTPTHQPTPQPTFVPTLLPSIAPTTRPTPAPSCLCVFDIDRTMTGKQGALGSTCPNNVQVEMLDSAYAGGALALSDIGQGEHLKNTFCATRGCYAAIVSAGDGSGINSQMRTELVLQLEKSGLKLAYATWSGPSENQEARRTCTQADATSTLLVGCQDGSTPEVVKGIIALLEASPTVVIPQQQVFFFDDNAGDVEAFRTTGFNARQVSCATRDGLVGLCGASASEIVDSTGVWLCGQATSQPTLPPTMSPTSLPTAPVVPLVPVVPVMPAPLAPGVNATGNVSSPIVPAALPTPQPTLEPCLCVFDTDRTTTGKQGVLAPTCPLNQELNMRDTAYGGGGLTLSQIGESIQSTFCASDGCYVGVVSAGDQSGEGSRERDEIVGMLKNSTAKLEATEWSGPSAKGEARRPCVVADAVTPLVLGCTDGSKQEAVKGMVQLIASTDGVTISPSRVWHFDDRENNVLPFQGTGMNARQVSCATRDSSLNNVVGLCGATPSEITNDIGVILCGAA